MTTPRVVTILYGTQTGCAEEVAQQLSRDCERHHLSVQLAAMDQFDFSALPTQSIVLFVCSTTGQGETPKTMKEFWRLLLRKSLPSDFLSAVKCAVFGLGDSSYALFNAVGKRLYTRLSQLGAQFLCRRGDGDDQHPLGVDGEFLPWRNELFSQLMSLCPLEEGMSVIPEHTLFPPRFPIHPVNGPCSTDAAFTVMPHAKLCPLVSCARITAETHFQDVRHVVFDIRQAGFSFEPGDVAAIMPVNPISAVRQLADRLQLDVDTFLLVPYLASHPIRVFDMFSRFLDICGTPRRNFFAILSHFTDDEREKERLLYFSSPEGNDDFLRYSRRERRTYVEVLLDFPSLRLPLDHVLDLIPRMRPRYFSIASAQVAKPESLELCVAVVKHLTPFRRIREGICSTYLAKLPVQSLVEMWVERGTLRLPPNEDTPCLMVGPGTGCAPFRAFCEARAAKKVGADAGTDAMYFGCRSRKGDFLYEQEWHAFPLRRFQAAFSRDQAHKVYVQHLIRADSSLVVDLLIHQKGYLYIAGNAKNMPDDVQGAIVECFLEHGVFPDKEAARKHLRSMELNKTFQMETWS
jgi:sulfite reductase alpha subunit-like flavoprotein